MQAKFGMKNESYIPLDVPPKARKIYLKNKRKLTRECERLMLFGREQKVEHLNDDFCGPGIALEEANPKHLFEIASRAKIGVFACLMSMYGMDYANVPYLVKLNSKTNLIKTSQADPISHPWLDKPRSFIRLTITAC